MRQPFVQICAGGREIILLIGVSSEYDRNSGVRHTSVGRELPNLGAAIDKALSWAASSTHTFEDGEPSAILTPKGGL